MKRGNSRKLREVALIWRKNYGQPIGQVVVGITVQIKRLPYIQASPIIRCNVK